MGFGISHIDFLSSSAFEDGTCGRHWDDYLCWPVSGVGSTVRIPCRASLPFVQAVMEAMPDIERDEIKGEHGRGSRRGWGRAHCYSIHKGTTNTSRISEISLVKHIFVFVDPSVRGN